MLLLLPPARSSLSACGPVGQSPVIAVIRLQRRARGPAFQLFPLRPSRKLVEAALEAGARGDAVGVLEGGKS